MGLSLVSRVSGAQEQVVAMYGISRSVICDIFGGSGSRKTTQLGAVRWWGGHDPKPMRRENMKATGVGATAAANGGGGGGAAAAAVEWHSFH